MIGPARIDENNIRRRQALLVFFCVPDCENKDVLLHILKRKGTKMKSPNDTNRVPYFMCWIQAVASARAKQKKLLQGCPVFKG